MAVVADVEPVKDGVASPGDDRANLMTQNKLRVEPIDNRHSAWGDVLASIFRAGRRDAMMICEHGWLSSRQTVLAAFHGAAVVGHLCFRVEATRSQVGQTAIKSRVDSFAVEEGYSDMPVNEMLLQKAQHQARLMNCPAPSVQTAGDQSAVVNI